MTTSLDRSSPPVREPGHAPPVAFEISEPRAINERRAQLENAEMLRRLRSL
jgi:hypothetical protein